MSTLLFWAAIIGVVAVAGTLAAMYAQGRFSSGGDRPTPRLDVVEIAAMDAKRRLVLIRRDDVEHLIITGGPVDVVVETGITGAGFSAAMPNGEPVDFTLPSRDAAAGPQAAPLAMPPPLNPPSTIDRSRGHELSLPDAPPVLADRA